MQWFKVFQDRQTAESSIAINTGKLVIIQKKRISLIRTKIGFYATDDSCPHMGESLSTGHINYLEEVVCPWHNYRYSLKNGIECEGRSADLLVYKVKIEDNGLFIGL